MTATFAIPATTFVLRHILQQRLNAAYGALTAPTVSVEPLPRPQSNTPANPANAQPEAPGLYLFMYLAGPNPSWRNMYEPHMDSSGAPTGPAPLAVDLHYMLAATGAGLDREALLGIGMATLTRNALLPRPMIQAILTSFSVPPVPTELMQRLPGEPLFDKASQPEQIKLSQTQADPDLATKLWSSLQSPLRPSAFFLATTIFLDFGDSFPEP